MVSLRSPSTLPIVGVLVDGRTYRHLLYLLLAIPLGFVYWMLFSFGFIFGLVFSVVLVGLVILFAMLIGARIAAGFERWLANGLLGTDLVRYDDVPADTDGALAGVKKYVEAPSTWRGVGFLSLKSSVTVVAFVPLIVLTNGLSLIVAPLRYPYVTDFGESNGEPVTWAIETFPEALLAVAIGVVAVLVALHVTNLVAYVSRQMATALLGEPAAGEDGSVVGESTDDTPVMIDDDPATTGPDPATTDSDPSLAGDEPGNEAPDESSSTDTEPPASDEFIPADAVDPKGDDDSVRDEDRS